MASPLKFFILVAIALLVVLADPFQLSSFGRNQPTGTWAQTISDRKIEAAATEQITEANRLWQQCIQQLQISQFQAATQSCQQAATLYRELNELKGEADSLSNLGIAYFSLGRYPQAIGFYQQSLAIKQKIGDRQGEANTLDNLGNVYLFQGQYQQALEAHQQALTIFQVIGDRRGEANAQINFGNTYRTLGQYPQAIEFYQQALKIVARDDRRISAHALTNLANAYFFLGQYPQSVEHHQQAIEIEQEIGDGQGEALSLISQGVVYEALQRPQQAVENYRRALTIAHDIGDPKGEAAALGNLGNVANRAGQPQQAIAFYRQALTISQTMGDRQSKGIALNNIGATLLHTSQFAQAAENLLDAAAIWESLRPGLADANKVSLLETQTITYRYLQLALVAQNKTAQALEASERGRARAFIEQLALGLDPQITAEALVTQNLPTLEQIKRVARVENATLVEYSLASDTEVYIWVIKPTGEITFQSKTLPEALGDMPLADFVIRSRQTLGVQRGTPFVSVRPREQAQTAIQQSRSLQQLYQLLIQPIAADLPSNPNSPIIFIPQRELFSVPFVALQDAQGNALIERHTILTAPAIGVLEKTHQQIARTRQTHFQDALVVGNPTMPYLSPYLGKPPQQLTPLLAAEREAKAIAPLLHTQPLINDQATEDVVVQRMPKARIIHLATHGVLDDVQGLNSAIALAPTGTDALHDGLLTAAEIFQMHLNADLVVLSACDTGRGRITGDGVIGLSRSFISVGVPSIIVSLWSIPDAPTAELMTEFYHQLQQTGNKAQALRQALLAIKASHPNPRDWAAFTLVGEAE